jgi:hypothetical protein
MAHHHVLPALVLAALQAASAQSGGASWKGAKSHSSILPEAFAACN